MNSRPRSSGEIIDRYEHECELLTVSLEAVVKVGRNPWVHASDQVTAMIRIARQGLENIKKAEEASVVEERGEHELRKM